MKLNVALPLLGLALAGNLQAAIVISEIDLLNNRVELVNTGSTTNIADWYFCNLVSGSPAYDQVDDRAVVVTALSSVGTSFTNFLGNSILVLEFTSGNFTPNTIGELGLYTTPSYTSASALEDYVAWGADGARDNVADAAGEWLEGAFVDLTGLGAGQTIQANPGTNGASPAEWSIGTSTLGATNVPEPSTAFLGILSLGLLARRRR